MKNISKKFIILSLLIFLSIFPIVNAQTVKLKFIETGDVHGSLFPYDFKSAKKINTSLAQIYTYVEEQRAKKDQAVILLDDGDVLQGQPVVYYYDYIKTNVPNICVQVMNYMKYDAGTVGNHDIEPGHVIYDKIKNGFKFPWLSANDINTKTDKPYFKPYAIIEKEGIKIAVLGMITPLIPDWLPKTLWSGMKFDDMVSTARKWIKIIKKKEKPDLIVGLFHSGPENEMKEYRDGKRDIGNASRLVAELVPGFDIVFAGHDHQVWNIKVKNSNGKNVLILDPANAARYAGVADVTMKFDKKTKTWKKKISGKIIDSKNYKPDAAYMKKFTPVIEEVKKYVSKPIGYFTKTISTRTSIFGDSPFVDLINKIQLEVTHADISFAAPLSLNAEIKKGTLHVGDMFNLYKYENLLYTMELTGKEIKGYLEYSYGNWFNQMKNKNDDLLKFEHDSAGNILIKYGRPVLSFPVFNYSSAAGINYVVNVSKPAGERVTITAMSDGKPFDMNKTYTVAINSYRGNGGGGHLIIGAKIPHDELAKRIIHSTQKDLRYYLMKWIEKKKIITPKSFNNWKVIPHSWWEKGKEKDYKILFH